MESIKRLGRPMARRPISEIEVQNERVVLCFICLNEQLKLCEASYLMKKNDAT